MSRQVIESSFTTSDGSSLFYRHWPAQSATPRGVIVLFHRGHEHSGRMAHVVDELQLPDFAFYAWDARGHGRNAGPRGFSPSFGRSVRDVDEFVRFAAAQHGLPLSDVGVIAQSVGAVTVSAWVHDHAPQIRCMSLASPAFKVKLYVPFARAGLALMHKLFGNFYVNSYVKAHYLTHDPARISSFNSDPLITRPISVNILLALYEAAERVVQDAGAIQVPTQLLISGADWVVHHAPQHEFFERLGSPVKEKHVLEGFYHDTLGEVDRHLAIAKLRSFLLERFEAEALKPQLLDAHQRGYSFDEYTQLARPLPLLSPKRWAFALSRLSMSSIGRLSSGVRLGFATGFDSGSTLDYVYRNEARGQGLVGRLIDRNYLDAIGWRGIRQRKLHVEQLLQLAISKLRAEGRPVQVLDIAAGHGRYILEGIEKLTQKPDGILLRDFSELNVEKGNKLIVEKGLQAIARFVQGDAFNRASLAAVSPRPTIGVVSGLYELFPDNALLRESLAGMADAVEPGGYLIYTGQPWHPQLEFIARVLSSHRDGKPWVMRRRVQAEMDQLVEAAGFTKLHTLADEWGIFTVSIARRNLA
ncbi:bifunctional alpha/beta hydrolase/class I SAM-dependent methyltransferase [Uliginosibacterium aquaticum]|uniref:Bifunctional alpha/beta hydrolase/class I SAM-dependent methyltransferase n=1 Tax=Uliginosibacterium aquaticum TaxID=2731212 RepID=A0ABX2IDD3_9RHOO|nr:bifunctional alpha/beta hydrolase/class I SAM-dependent methyltransferase [Uliginosibacterium aquaticum]NSL54586.1 bifunctional alpha/beta hydrolase/class I SAM-dependent methyltransferase [Uliginosibacterium aquaticum]